MRTQVIRVNDACPVDSVSEIISLIAYPAPGERIKREMFRDALTRTAYFVGAMDDPAWAMAPQLIRPRILLAAGSVVTKCYRAGMLRAVRRMIVVHAVVKPHLDHLSTGKLRKLKTGHWPTVENCIMSMGEHFKVSPGSVDTVKARVWGPAKPIAHLALAVLDTMNMELYRRAEMNRSLYDRSNDKLLLRAIVTIHPAVLLETAKDYRAKLPLIKQFRIRESDLLQVDWV